MNLYGYEFQRKSDLSHYGVLGMKWGVRRYQNADGSLTKEGKTHYYGESGLTDKDAKQLEKNISKLSKRKASYKIHNLKKRKEYLGESLKLNKEIVKAAFDISKKSGKLSSIIDKDRKLANLEDGVWRGMLANENNMKRTISDFLKDEQAINKSDFSINWGIKGPIRKSDVDSFYKKSLNPRSYEWECLANYFAAHSPELRKYGAERYKLSNEFRTESKNAFSQILGEYGNTKVKRTPNEKECISLAEYLSKKANDYYGEYSWRGDSMFIDTDSKKK